MAIGTIVPATGAGHSPSAPTFIDRLLFPGDSAYTTGGTLMFEDSVRAILERDVTIIDVVGYGYSAANVATHLVRYLRSTDALEVYVIATGAQVANAANLSTTTFDVTVFSQ